MPTTSLNVPLLPQSDRTDCLPACVEMVLAFFGHQVKLNDPASAGAPQNVSRNAFLLAWSDFDHLYAVIRPA